MATRQQEQEWRLASSRGLKIWANRHGHPLMMMDHEDTRYTCSECKQMGFGKRLKCKLTTCTHYKSHPDCAETSSKLLRHPLRPGCSFRFHSSGGRNDNPCAACGTRTSGTFSGGRKDNPCAACGTRTSGTFYRCDHCNMAFHLYCLRLTPELTVDGGHTIALKDKVVDTCSMCKLPSNETGETRRRWVYESVTGRLSLHVYCAKKLIAEMIRTDVEFRQRIVPAGGGGGGGYRWPRPSGNPTLTGMLAAVASVLLGTHRSSLY